MIQTKMLRINEGRWCLGKVTVFAALLFATACVGTEEVGPISDRALVPLALRDDARSVIRPGEEFVYGVAWSGFLPVGRVIYRTGESEDGSLLTYRGITEPSMFVEAFLEAGGVTEVLVDRETLLPRAASWRDASREDPLVRTALFDRTKMEALATVRSKGSYDVRRIQGPVLTDPLSTIYLVRVLARPEPGSDVRVQIVEGIQVHLAVFSFEGHEALIHEGKRMECELWTVATYALDEQGQRKSEDPDNLLNAWVAELPLRPILRMAGKTIFGKVALRLAHHLPGDMHGS